MELHLYGLATGVKVDVDALMCSRSATTGKKPSLAATRAWIQLMRAQRIVLSAIESDLKQAALPQLGWYDVLLELIRAEGGRLRPYDIEERLLLAQHNLSRLLDRMENRGLVRREPFADDGRGRWVIITDEGCAMQVRMWEIYAVSIQSHFGGKVDDAKATQLGDLLLLLSRPGQTSLRTAVSK